MNYPFCMQNKKSINVIATTCIRIGQSSLSVFELPTVCFKREGESSVFKEQSEGNIFAYFPLENF